MHCLRAHVIARSASGCRIRPSAVRLRTSRRLFSDGKKSAESGAQKSVAEAEAAQDALMNAPLTVQEKFSATFWIGLLGVGAVCFVFTVRELMPSAMSSNYVMDEAFSQARKSAEVVSILGEPMKAYGIDHGGHREGRRNFIHSREVEGEDGSKRLKVRFNLEGPFGGAVCFAEVSDQLDAKNGEWVYLIVQSKRTGQAITLCDNRQTMAAMAAAKSPEVRQHTSI